MNRADKFNILRKKPKKDYDISFLITNFHLEFYKKEAIIDFIVEFVQDLEKEIKRLTKAKDRLELKVADLAVSGDHVELTRLGGELTAVLAELNTAEEQWLELTEEAERASN
jgi:hypothetical protein